MKNYNNITKPYRDVSRSHVKHLGLMGLFSWPTNIVEKLVLDPTVVWPPN